jgi:hypothetical protein
MPEYDGNVVHDMANDLFHGYDSESALDWYKHRPRLMEIAREMLDAIHWCRIGGGNQPTTRGSNYAKRAGYLAQDPVWRATPDGEAMLLAALRSHSWSEARKATASAPKDQP